MEERKQTCGGITKQGRPCNITWGLDALGFCKFHEFNAQRCQGIARSTGRRCAIRWDLDPNGFCSHHRLQDARQCIAMAAKTKRRCQNTSGIDANGCCAVHQVRDITTPRCQGVYVDSKKRCTKSAKPGYDYCCAPHNPALTHISPRMFSSTVTTRARMEDQVVALYKGRDLYHFDALDLTAPDRLEMDHIAEKQLFSEAFRRLDFRDGLGDMDFVAGIVRDEIVNEPENLCLTRKTTNRIKGAATWKFLDDSITGHVGYHGNGATFTGYMLAETLDNERLGRHTTRVIAREMGSSLKRCQRQLEAEEDTPILGELAAELQRLYVTMQLQNRDRR